MSRGWGRGRGRWEGLAARDALEGVPADEARLREALFRGAGLPVFEGVTPEEWEEALGDGRSVGREGERHLSASVVAFVPGTREALLLWHRKAGEWVYPGGHPDGDWNLLRAALRELEEETGLRADQGTLWHPADVPPHVPPYVQGIAIPERIGESTHRHLDAVFFVSFPAAVRDAVRLSDTETGAHKWVQAIGGKASPLDALPRPTQSALRFLRDEVLPAAQRASVEASPREGL